MKHPFFTPKLGRIGGFLVAYVVCLAASQSLVMAQKADARSHPAEQLGFRFAVVSGADLPHQLSIVQFNVHHHTFYV